MESVSDKVTWSYMLRASLLGRFVTAVGFGEVLDPDTTSPRTENFPEEIQVPDTSRKRIPGYQSETAMRSISKKTPTSEC